MTVSRELLWMAYPEGFLPMRGVTSLARWTCSGDNGDGTDLAGLNIHWRHFGLHSTIQYRPWTKRPWEYLFNGGDAEGIVKDGHLLPNLDPKDPATWACVKHDLAVARYPAATSPYLVGWRQTRRRPAKGVLYWTLSVYWRAGTNDGVVGEAHHFGVDTDDPATALAMARAQLREQQ